MSVYTVFDIPAAGQFTNAGQLSLFNGLKTMWSATSDAVLTKFLNGES